MIIPVFSAILGNVSVPAFDKRVRTFLVDIKDTC